MNVTFDIDEHTIARARELASEQGVSLDELIQRYLEELTSRMSSEEMLRTLNELWGRGSGDSDGREWTREELHERLDIH